MRLCRFVGRSRSYFLIEMKMGKYRFEFLNNIRRGAEGGQGAEEVSPHRPQMDHLEGLDKRS